MCYILKVSNEYLNIYYVDSEAIKSVQNYIPLLKIHKKTILK